MANYFNDSMIYSNYQTTSNSGPLSPFASLSAMDFLPRTPGTCHGGREYASNEFVPSVSIYFNVLTRFDL